jgi:uroporphyrin-III C-methyltransferase / precorrin-2 dehydrogenase / sirohydrochlorin ferrochelatase
LEDLSGLVKKIDGGPAVLIIGDVVAHSAPWLNQKGRLTQQWRSQNLNQVIGKLLEAAE